MARFRSEKQRREDFRRELEPFRKAIVAKRAEEQALMDSRMAPHRDAYRLKVDQLRVKHGLPPSSGLNRDGLLRMADFWREEAANAKTAEKRALYLRLAEERETEAKNNRPQP